MSNREKTSKVISRIEAQIAAIDGNIAECEMRAENTSSSLRLKCMDDEGMEVAKHITIEQCLNEAARELHRLIGRRFGLCIALDIVENTK